MAEEAESHSFITFANIGLGALCGALIVFPLVLEAKNIVYALPGIAVGALIGHRRKDSRVFFYLTLVSILILASLISFVGLGKA